MAFTLYKKEEQRENTGLKFENGRRAPGLGSRVGVIPLGVPFLPGHHAGSGGPSGIRTQDYPVMSRGL